MHVRLKSLIGSDVPAGALYGREILRLLLGRLKGEPAKPEVMYLDFAGIEVATASFLRECILEFKESVRRRWPNYYPVIANANEAIAEELLILLTPQRDVLMLCSLDEAGSPSCPRLLGDLEPKQRVTFEMVRNLGEADARELMRDSRRSESVGQTAWNNRLAKLARNGLLMELSHGRAKRYRPLPLGA